jgi:ElaB/YqjD/DUF883 family membrane-anchored ribosome-binding protein
MNDYRKSAESFGRTLDDAKDQMGDTAKDLYNQSRKSSAQAFNAAKASVAEARETAFSLEGALRDFIEHQPYTAVAVGLAFGWLLGRIRRPL